MALVFSKISDNTSVELLDPNCADDVEQSLEVIRRGFLQYESVCVGLEINHTDGYEAGEELCELTRDIIKDGLSIIIRDLQANKIVSVAINKLQVKTSGPGFFEVFRNERCKTEQSIKLIEFMEVVDSKCNLFEKYNTDCLLELTFLATLPEYGRRSFGRAVTDYTVKLAKELKRGEFPKTSPAHLHSYRPQIVSAIFTSSFSQKIGKRLKFNELVEVPFTEFKYKGKTFADRIGPQHPISILVSKALN